MGSERNSTAVSRKSVFTTRNRLAVKYFSDKITFGCKLGDELQLNPVGKVGLNISLLDMGASDSHLLAVEHPNVEDSIHAQCAQPSNKAVTK